MTIPRTWSAGVASMPVSSPQQTPMLSSADLATLDAGIQRAVDKQSTATSLEAVVTLGAGGVISLDTSSALIDVQGAITTANGGRIQCGDNDFVQFSAPRTRTVYTSFTEAFLNFSGGHIPFGPANTSIVGLFPAGVTPKWNWYADPPSGNMQPGNDAGNVDESNSALFLPITRTHDQAGSLVLHVYFLVASGRTVRPARYPGVNLLRVDPFLGTVESISGGWIYFPPAASISAYKNGGVSNVISVSATGGTLDVDRYVYVLAVLDEDYGGADVASNRGNLYAGVSEVTSTSDMRFP